MNNCEASPVVSILIATKDRPEDLRRTLRQLLNQQYPNLELIVIDDGSSAEIEPIVRENWPGAVFVRHDQSAGQCMRRSEGFALARGEFILQLDDDASPVQQDGISHAVKLAVSKPHLGAIAFQIFNGEVLPKDLRSGGPRYTHSFVGCGVLFRTTALRGIGGYCSFFGNEWEEEELSLRLMKAGWGLYFLPSVLIHHHVSARNRNTDRTWMRGLRNKLWALVMHCPAPRIFIEMCWVLLVGLLDAIRLLRFRRFCQGLVSFSAGLPRALRLRSPLDKIAMRRYDALRFLSGLTDENYNEPPRCTFADLRHWFTRSWWNRPRQRSFWDGRAADIGECATVTFAHEYDPAKNR